MAPSLARGPAANRALILSPRVAVDQPPLRSRTLIAGMNLLPSTRFQIWQFPDLIRCCVFVTLSSPYEVPAKEENVVLCLIERRCTVYSPGTAHPRNNIFVDPVHIPVPYDTVFSTDAQ